MLAFRNAGTVMAQLRVFRCADLENWLAPAWAFAKAAKGGLGSLGSLGSLELGMLSPEESLSNPPQMSYHLAAIEDWHRMRYAGEYPSFLGYSGR